MLILIALKSCNIDGIVEKWIVENALQKTKNTKKKWILDQQAIQEFECSVYKILGPFQPYAPA
jgi:hypothetical protein